ncbi:MAG: hypothetical protein CL967_00325 [Euryarchaeota archaeon]|nr:hypothetical protein [Euryarchaeota archaeon]
MRESITVHKFGGSCLRDISDLNRIAEVIQHWPGQSMLVVSALWGTTDRLMRASKEPRYASRLVYDLSSQHLRFAPGLIESEYRHLFLSVLEGIEQSLNELAQTPNNWNATNRLLAAGERLSALVVAYHLQKFEIDAHPLGAEDIGLKLKGSNRAQIVDIETSMIELDRSAFFGTPVITGWFGEGTDGELALLGRGGSDHTATSIARLVDADKVILWKDVDGVLPINPRWGIESKPIPYLGYSEAVELARLDTPVLHPATVEPLRQVGIPLEIRDLRSVYKEMAASVIGPDLHQSYQIKAIGCLPRIARISVSSSSDGILTEMLGRILIDLSEQNIACWNLNTQPDSISWIVSQHNLDDAYTIISNHFSNPEIEEYGVMFSLVGNKLPGENEEFLSQELIEMLEIEIVSKTDHAVRIISKKRDIQAMLDLLANHLQLSTEP